VTAALTSPPIFVLPRTAVITDPIEVARYDTMLVDAIISDDGSADFAHAGHEIVGVDFVFSGDEKYTLTASHHHPRILGEADLDLEALRDYIKDEGIARTEILGIRVRVDNEGQRTYSKTLKESLDYIVDGENVMLSQGRWLRFNEDYVDQLNTSVDVIAVESTDPEFEEISTGEPDFNDSSDVAARGYTKADKDFSKIRTRASTPIEAWDLRRGGTVYAVKFGTAQKLGYVCDQANAVVEIVRNNANVKQLDPDWRAYCLWLGFRTVTTPARMSEVNSIILKQKMDAWARGCRNIGIEPKLKFSRRV
jgi:uncharacterized protein (TIGR04141 family)